MKSKKVLKRIAKIEAWISEVTKRSSQSAPHVRELLRDAKAAVLRAKEAIEASPWATKNPSAKRAKPAAKATQELSTPKRKPSTARRKAVLKTMKKRVVAKKSATSAVTKKATGKNATSVKAAKNSARKVKKTAAKRAAGEAPIKKALSGVQVANTPAPLSIEDSAVSTSEATTPETPAH